MNRKEITKKFTVFTNIPDVNYMDEDEAFTRLCENILSAPFAEAQAFVANDICKKKLEGIHLLRIKVTVDAFQGVRPEQLLEEDDTLI